MITQEYFGVIYKVESGGGCPECYFVDKDISSQTGGRIRHAAFCHTFCKIDHLKYHWVKYEDSFDWGFLL